MDGEPSLSLLGGWAGRTAVPATPGRPSWARISSWPRRSYGCPLSGGSCRVISAGAARRRRSGRPGSAGAVVADSDVRRRCGVQAAAVLRQAVGFGADNPRPLHHRARRLRSAQVFSPGVRWAVYEALLEARRWGVRHARPEHLVVGLLALPGGAASAPRLGWPTIGSAGASRSLGAPPSSRRARPACPRDGSATRMPAPSTCRPRCLSRTRRRPRHGPVGGAGRDRRPLEARRACRMAHAGVARTGTAVRSATRPPETPGREQ